MTYFSTHMHAHTHTHTLYVYVYFICIYEHHVHVWCLQRSEEDNIQLHIFSDSPIQGERHTRTETSSAISPFNSHENEETKLSHSEEKQEQEASWKREEESSSRWRAGSAVLCGQSTWAGNEVDCLGSVRIARYLSKFVFKKRWDQEPD